MFSHDYNACQIGGHRNVRSTETSNRCFGRKFSVISEKVHRALVRHTQDQDERLPRKRNKLQKLTVSECSWKCSLWLTKIADWRQGKLLALHAVAPQDNSWNIDHEWLARGGGAMSNLSKGRKDKMLFRKRSASSSRWHTRQSNDLFICLKTGNDAQQKKRWTGRINMEFRWWRIQSYKKESTDSSIVGENILTLIEGQ